MNVHLDNYVGTIVRVHTGLYYFSVFELELFLDNWMNTTIKTETQLEKYQQLMQSIPVHTNYHVLTEVHALCTFKSVVVNRPFGTTYRTLRDHLCFFRMNEEGCGGHHKVVLSGAQYKLLLSFLPSPTWTDVPGDST